MDATTVPRKKSLKGTWPRALLSFFGPIALILAIRWAVIEPYVIPSGSMIPNLLIHDHIAVQKFSFGLRLPFSDRWLVRWADPHRGDIVVFRFPENPEVFYIKRLIGLPGDKIEVTDGRVTVNGESWPLAPASAVPGDEAEDFDYFRETVAGRDHLVRFQKGRYETGTARDWTLADGEYFFMGDNRDQSSDGRVWGTVPDRNLIGRAWFVWLSCDEMLDSARFVCNPSTIRWNRFLKSVLP